MSHLSDLDLERYHLGMVSGEELDALEEHIVGCGECAECAEEAADYVDAIRAGIIAGNFDIPTLHNLRWPSIWYNLVSCS